MSLDELIRLYFRYRGYHWPDVNEALQFALTELGEACEVLLARNPNWVRNHPEDKPQYYSPIDFEEELADAIMMLQVAGMVECLDPIEALARKLERKLLEKTAPAGQDV